MNQIVKQTKDITTVRDAVDCGMKAVLLEDLKAKITEAALYRGIAIKAEDTELAARMYMDDLERLFPMIDLKEITTILRNGIRKEYGEFYGINAGTLYDWTTEYLQSPERQMYVQAKRQDQPKLLEKRTQRSQEEVDADIRRQVNEAYMKYINRIDLEEVSGSFAACIPVARSKYPIGHPLWDPGSHMEDWLHDKGIAGSLKEIFDRAAGEGKQEII